MGAINAFLAHEAEQVSRHRFKKQRHLKLTEERSIEIIGTLMPPRVVEQLQDLPDGTLLQPRRYHHATITQLDLCGFTKLASTKTPVQVVNLIEDLFGAFDTLTGKYGIYKVETVGDAYIAGMAEHTLTARNSPANA